MLVFWSLRHLLWTWHLAPGGRDSDKVLLYWSPRHWLCPCHLAPGWRGLELSKLIPAVTLGTVSQGEENSLYVHDLGGGGYIFTNLPQSLVPRASTLNVSFSSGRKRFGIVQIVCNWSLRHLLCRSFSSYGNWKNCLPWYKGLGLSKMFVIGCSGIYSVPVI